MKTKKILTITSILILIALSGVLGAKAEELLKEWLGQNDLVEVEETTERLVNIINRLDDDIKNSNKNLSQARLDLAIMTDKYNAEAEALALKTIEYDQLLLDYQTEQSNHEATKSQLTQLQSDIATLEQDLEDLEVTLSSKENIILDLEASITNLTSEKASLQRQLDLANIKYNSDITYLNNEIEKANSAASNHRSEVCIKLQELPFVYQLEFKDQCESIKSYKIETETGTGTNLRVNYSSFKLADLSNSTGNSLYLGTDVDKTSDRIETEYNNWQIDNLIEFTYEGATGRMTLNVNGSEVDQLVYSGTPLDMNLFNTIKITMVESSGVGYETGELIINNITLNGETETQSYNIIDNTLTLNFIGNLTDLNDNVNLSFNLQLLGTMADGEDTNLVVYIGES